MQTPPPSQVECVWEIAAHSSLRDVFCDLIVRVVTATVSSSLGQHCIVCNTCLGCFFCSDSGRDIVGCWALVWLLLLTVFMGIIEWFAGGRREPVCGGASFVLLCNAVVVPFQCKQVARLPVTLFHRQERKRHCVMNTCVTPNGNIDHHPGSRQLQMVCAELSLKCTAQRQAFGQPTSKASGAVVVHKPLLTKARSTETVPTQQLVGLGPTL